MKKEERNRWERKPEEQEASWDSPENRRLLAAAAGVLALLILILCGILVFRGMNRGGQERTEEQEASWDSPENRRLLAAAAGVLALLILILCGILVFRGMNRGGQERTENTASGSSQTSMEQFMRESLKTAGFDFLPRDEAALDQAAGEAAALLGQLQAEDAGRERMVEQIREYLAGLGWELDETQLQELSEWLVDIYLDHYETIGAALGKERMVEQIREYLAGLGWELDETQLQELSEWLVDIYLDHYETIGAALGKEDITAMGDALMDQMNRDLGGIYEYLDQLDASVVNNRETLLSFTRNDSYEKLKNELNQLGKGNLTLEEKVSLLFDQLELVQNGVALSKEEVRKLLEEMEGADLIRLQETLEKFTETNNRLSHVRDDMNEAHDSLRALMELVKGGSEKEHAQLLAVLKEMEQSFSEQNTAGYDALIESLRTQTSDLAAMFDAVNRNMAQNHQALSQNVQEVGQGVNEVGQEVGKVGQGVSEVGQEVGKVGQGVSEVGQEVGKVGQGVGEVGQEVGKVSQGVSEVGLEVGKVGQGVGQGVSEVGQEVGKVGQGVGEVGQEVGKVSQGVSEVGLEVGKVGQGVGEVGQEVGRVGQGVAEVGQGVTKVGQGVNKVSQEVAEVGKGVAESRMNLTSRLEEVEKKLLARIGNVTQGMTGSQSELLERLAQMESSSNARFSGLDQAVQSVFQRVSNGKKLLASALLTKNVTVDEDASFREIYDGIMNIKQEIVIGTDRLPGKIEYEYHHHTGNEVDGGGCYTVPNVHQHVGSCYVVCHVVRSGCHSDGNYNVNGMMHCPVTVSHSYCWNGETRWSEEVHPDDGNSHVDEDRHSEHLVTVCGKNAGVQEGWKTGCGLNDGQIIGAHIVYDASVRPQQSVTAFAADNGEDLLPVPLPEEREPSRREEEKQEETENLSGQDGAGTVEGNGTQNDTESGKPEQDKGNAGEEAAGQEPDGDGVEPGKPDETKPDEEAGAEPGKPDKVKLENPGGTKPEKS